MAKFFAWLGGIFTDALGRPEVKMMLGVPLAVTAVAYGMGSRDWIGFGALAGVALTLMGITAGGDAVIDRAQIAAGSGK
jgi:hypothetical protein